MKRTKRKETRKRKNIHNTFSSPSVWSGLFFFFSFPPFPGFLHTPPHATKRCLTSLPQTHPHPTPPHPTLLLPAKLQKVRTWLRTRGCGGRCSARSLRSPFWCGTPGRTPAEETQNRSLSTFKILQTISGQRSETGGVVENETVIAENMDETRCWTHVKHPVAQKHKSFQDLKVAYRDKSMRFRGLISITGKYRELTGNDTVTCSTRRVMVLSILL